MEGQWLPSYIRANRRGSSTKLRRLAFCESGNEDLLPTAVLTYAKDLNTIIINIFCHILLRYKLYGILNE